MISQIEFTLGPFYRGIHLITSDVIANIGDLPEKGILYLMIKHTSAAITINENADPTVREDMDYFLNRLIPDNYPGFKHIFEGSDDMTAHIKTSLIGTSLSVPVTHGTLNLGTWQGIYLCEFRNKSSKRNFIATISS